MNGPYNSGDLIEVPGGGLAFVDGIPDDCPHDYSESVYQTKSGKWIFWHTYRQWATLTSAARYDLIMKLHGPGGMEEDDPAKEQYGNIFARKVALAEDKSYASICYNQDTYGMIYWSWRAIKAMAGMVRQKKSQLHAR